MYRFVWRPSWLIGHVLILAACVAMVLLGRWQLDVSNSKGFSLQNFGYALQWWAFSIAAVIIWVRIIRDRARPGTQRPAPPAPVRRPVAYRRYVMPTEVDAGDDAELTRYNTYLRSLDNSASSDRGSDADG